MKVAATALLRCKDDWHPARDTEAAKYCCNTK